MKTFAIARTMLVALGASAALLLSGCGIGNLAAPVSVDTIASAFGGTMHGGPNPVIGARVVIYATTSTGYGIGTPLQEANANFPSGSPVAHQDTDASGFFHFAGGFTCPAGQFAYIVAYGGNTGAGNNPNSIFVSPVGSCDTLYTGGTVYNGSNIWIDELTTVATAYALNNFTSVTGDAVNGYTVGIGAPASNNAFAGCVVNGYYPSCTAAAAGTNANAAGLKHAFANALALVSNHTGVVSTTTANGALVPATFINTLGNIMQACVNSTGGGTDASTGLPTTVTTASGVSHDGTLCGKFFAFSSYTNNGTATGTLTAAGNTLDAIKNLAKRPGGANTTFDNACSSNSATGNSNTAVNCLYGLAPPNGFYNPALTVAPPDWMLGISYAKGALNTGTGFSTAAGCATNTTSNGLFYPTYVATDINDNILILNADASTPICANMIAIGADGSISGSSGIDTGAAAVDSIAVDAWGHVLLPLKGGNGVRFFQYGAGGTSDPADTTLPIVATVTSPATSGSTTTSAYKANYAAVDGNNRIYVGSIATVNDWGYLAPVTLSHTLPAYTSTQLTSTATTSNIFTVAVDFKNNAVAAKGNSNLLGTASGGSTFNSSSGTGSAASTNVAALGVDTSGNTWQVVNNGTTATTIVKFPYTAVPAGNLTWTAGFTTATAPSYTFPTNTTASLENGVNAGGLKAAAMDGANELWFVDLFGVSTAPPYGSFLRGYDTVNNYGTPQLRGCKLPTGSTACGSNSGDATYPSNTPWLLYQTRGIAVDTMGNLWVANGTQGQVNEILGIAAPTLPTYIHNGISNLP